MKLSAQSTRKAILVGLLTCLLPFFQNCSQKGSQSVRFDPTDPKNTSGNGQPYDGKPDPGDYYRVIPGYTCQGNPSLAGKISVTDSAVESTTVNPDCTETQKTLTFSDVEGSAINPANLSYRDGIYEAASVAPAPTATAPETYCRSVITGTKAFEILVHKSNSGTLSASLKNGTTINETLAPSGAVSGNNYVYQAGAVRLELSLRTQGASPGQVRGYLTHASESGEVTCRTTHNPPAPTGGYMVLSASTTAGDFGGLAGGNAFCLNQLTNNDFKGKVNVTLDAAHVSAFLCDGSTCNSLLNNHSYTFAAAGRPSVGGLAFMTNASGLGPGSMFAWSTSDVFDGTYLAWTNRAGDSAGGTLWYNTPESQHCNNWTSNSSSVTGLVGISSSWNGARWNNGGNNCNDSRHLICLVQAP
ncbi:MAG: hypothetical protein KF799_02760 [Bdellovibrionales bacterium]|nr:hypothetical protein [Bdellovibrionales bacterium]